MIYEHETLNNEDIVMATDHNIFVVRSIKFIVFEMNFYSLFLRALILIYMAKGITADSADQSRDQTVGRGLIRR